MTFEVTYIPPPPGDEGKVNLPFEMKNLGWIRQYPYSHKPNLIYNDDDSHEAVIQELKYFKECGGGTIVENTTHGITRDMCYLKRAAEESGVNVIAGSGYYVSASHPSQMDAMRVEDIVEVMRNDFLTGCDGTDIKCGVIGEIGCSWPLHDNEKKVLRATVEAQTQLGCPVIIHPGRHHEAPSEIVRLLQEEGGNTGKTVMSHLDRTFHADDLLLDFAKMGTYLEFDLFGFENSNYQTNPAVDMPGDGERIRRIKILFDNGFDKVVISHDMHFKHRLIKYGGHGYTHILRNVLPQMRRRGVTQEQIDKMLIDNPREWLTFL
ncbi:phosphotriesterase-related protein [Lingula anatina]|uniref:Phosphotriesterase-related protein n=1 Tax=Lingula anatina TaxID=7574 RepID=A0A1S3H2U9_LINAN|nr:phosphotriesterase-related protein [Lingula anatina]|eukprot:XP_013380455.1 phosphotriesterase-related protein [Lingula anatina]